MSESASAENYAAQVELVRRKFLEYMQTYRRLPPPPGEDRAPGEMREWLNADRQFVETQLKPVGEALGEALIGARQAWLFQELRGDDVRAVPGELEAGEYGVVLEVEKHGNLRVLDAVALAVLGMTPPEALHLAQKLDEIGRQRILSGVSFEAAMEVRDLLESAGWKASIRDAPPATRAEQTSLRPSIPRDVRVFVWNRDGGSCVECGSRERLEYDHIIPLSRGGANTARNIELRCEVCNRRKGANI